MHNTRTKGKHPSKALSPLKIKSIKERGRYADGNGLYLVVDPAGSKRWVLRTVIHGRRRDIGLGGVATVSLAEARTAAQKLRQEARQGADPMAIRRAARTAIPCFREAAVRVHAGRMTSWRNGKHQAQWLSSLEAHTFPSLGSKRIDQIQAHDVLGTISTIWASKPETARRVLQRLRMVFDWAKASGFRNGDNPVDGLTAVLPRQAQNKRHMTAMPFADVPGFVQEIASSAEIPSAADRALEFLILTAGRTNEVLGAQWREIDFSSRIWTIPKGRMKAAREHRVPLSDRALEILSDAKLVDAASAYVFPGFRSGRPLSNMALLMRLRRMKVPFTVHGFRSAFRDWASERTNFSREVCEMALAHTIKSKAEAAYRRGDLLEKRRELMETWTRFVSGQSGEVVQLRSG